ncbi:unnamed protein product [Moneuplotes crassus]|uniref:Uncharacterized protein n=1 Tax=Euplotes crassus TaxID=5936 RepID=A0AAD2D759_EUPCR|nr:unnamed protein product [Moneuplotes crassus]
MAGICYTYVFFLITSFHWLVFRLIYDDGRTYKDIIDPTTIDHNEYKDTIVAWYRNDTDVASLHEQFAYEMAEKFPDIHVYFTIIITIWVATMPLFFGIIMWFYCYEKHNLGDPMERARKELALEREKIRQLREEKKKDQKKDD